MSKAWHTISSGAQARGATSLAAYRRRAGLAASARSAFTLIELLVVIAITAVLLTLLVRPLLYGLQFTNEAQATTVAQDAARVTMEQVSREIGSAAAVRDTSSQYLNMRIFSTTGNDEVLAHAYNAYIDLIPARSANNTAATVADPTVNPYANVGNGDGFYVKQNSTTGESTLVNSPVQLPLAPGTTLVRYFIGLTRPFNLPYTGTGTAEEEPYVNIPEGQVPSAASSVSGRNDWATSYDIQHNLNNPYILYRAEVSPYKYVAGTNGKPGTYQANTQLFDTKTINGVSTPVLDDPDFFRIIGDAAHDARVYHWFQTAKPVIDSSDANLIFQAHDNFGNVLYASTKNVNVGTAAAPNKQTLNLASGTALESASGIPIVRTSVSFTPATVSDDPMSPTNTADVSQGFGSSPTDAQVPYIPTEFTSQSGQWSGNKNLLITDNSALANANSSTPNTYTTYIYHPDPSATANPLKSDGDLIEAVTTSSSSNDAFDVSTGCVLDSAQSYIVFSASAGGGAVSFSTPDLPATMSTPGTLQALTTQTKLAGATCGNADPTNNNNPFWFVTFHNNYTGATTDGNGNTVPSSYGSSDTGDVLQIHLKPQPQLTGYDEANDAVLLPHPAVVTSGNSANYLPNIATASFGATGTYTSGYPSSNGRVVINSERVYGPDETAGAASIAIPSTGTQPANYPVVVYRRIPFIIGQIGSIGANQYMIDYDHGIIYLGQPKSAGGPIDITQSDGSGSATDNPAVSTVLVAFNYQNNAYIPLDTTTHDISPTALANGSIKADTVRATYQTNSRIEVAIGVRLYDAQTNHPTYFSLANAVTVGNASR